MQDLYDVIILGAGGAGLMAAATAGQRGKRVLLLDHAEKPGKKILISGGGRCNFTNLGIAPDRFLSENRHFHKSALSRYTAQNFVALVEKHRIEYHEKTLGQLFCDGSARQIVAMLLAECEAGGVDLRLQASGVPIEHRDGHFHVAGARAPSLIVATGGPSIPKMGATGVAYAIAEQFGLSLVDPRPALVPFTLGPEEALFSALSGVATETIARLGKTAFREASLFTHKGLSGPAILQISSYWQEGDTISLDLLPGHGTGALVDAKRAMPRKGLRAGLATLLPDRLADALTQRFGNATELGNWSDKALNQLEDKLRALPFTPSGTEGYAKAEVTAGGISTSELSSTTLEAKQVAGLYFIGEAVDVTGWLGGYNFQWAWSSGVAAGQAV